MSRPLPDLEVTLTVDGRVVRASRGASVAAALLDAGVRAFRTSVSGEPRAPLCGMGVCHECRVEIDGVGQRRACMITVSEGMRVRTGARS
jgi:D-hydroxyproline dehydrogenase subunit gamma